MPRKKTKTVGKAAKQRCRSRRPRRQAVEPGRRRRSLCVLGVGGGGARADKLLENQTHPDPRPPDWLPCYVETLLRKAEGKGNSTGGQLLLINSKRKKTIKRCWILSLKQAEILLRVSLASQNARDPGAGRFLFKP